MDSNLLGFAPCNFIKTDEADPSLPHLIIILIIVVVVVVVVVVKGDDPSSSQQVL